MLESGVSVKNTGSECGIPKRRCRAGARAFPARKRLGWQGQFFSDPINGYSERSRHHPGLSAMSSYLGAPGSSPAGKGSEDAELGLGRSQGKRCCVWVWCFRGEDTGSEADVPKRRCRAGARAFPARKRLGWQG